MSYKFQVGDMIVWHADYPDLQELAHKRYNPLIIVDGFNLSRNADERGLIIQTKSNLGTIRIKWDLGDCQTYTWKDAHGLINRRVWDYYSTKKP